jgi:hypothetical protein
MEPEDTPDDAFDVTGYFQCIECHKWIVEGQPGTSVRLCRDCAATRAAEAEVARLNYEVEGRVYEMGPAERIRRTRKRTISEASAERTKLANKAYYRALHRLAQIHRPLFDVLLVEEKAALGLDPVVRHHDLPARAIAREILDHHDNEIPEWVERGRDRIEDRHAAEAG